MQGSRLVTGLTTDPVTGEVVSVEAADRSTGARGSAPGPLLLCGVVVGTRQLLDPGILGTGFWAALGGIQASREFKTPGAHLPSTCVAARPCPVLQMRDRPSPPTGETYSYPADALVFAVGITGMQKLVAATPALAQKVRALEVEGGSGRDGAGRRRRLQQPLLGLARPGIVPAAHARYSYIIHIPHHACYQPYACNHTFPILRFLQPSPSRSPVLPPLTCAAQADFRAIMELRALDVIATRVWFDRRVSTRYPANVLSGFEATAGATFFNLNDLQVRG